MYWGDTHISPFKKNYIITNASKYILRIKQKKKLKKIKYNIIIQSTNNNNSLGPKIDPKYLNLFIIIRIYDFSYTQL